MGKGSAHISEVGNYGDGREEYASKYLLEQALPNDPAATLVALEEFGQRWSLLHLGKEKGRHLDRFVREVQTGTSPPPPVEPRRKERIRALEIGSYIGYSAIRIGRLLAEKNNGSTLLSVEQNEDNAKLARKHVAHAGLDGLVTVVRANIQEHFSSQGTGGGHARSEAFDFVFIDHRKPFYLRDLKFLEARGVIDAAITTVVADNVASLEHILNRQASIARGKRRKACQCVNRACNYMDYVQNSGRYVTEVFWGAKDGISVSKPRRAEDRSQDEISSPKFSAIGPHESRSNRESFDPYEWVAPSREKSRQLSLAYDRSHV